MQQKSLNNPYTHHMHTNYTGGACMVDARVSLNEYTNRLLMVVKAKYGLKDKSEAINKFAELYGEEEVERKVKPSYLKKLDRIQREYYKKYPHGHRMTDAELDKLFGK